ncbi:MAG: hypothetical protein NT007_11995 [Candidatus Kapabacteria bacterium]|nr:hypothetical protein [Candidatus Kapabacteria bacterium]
MNNKITIEINNLKRIFTYLWSVCFQKEIKFILIILFFICNCTFVFSQPLTKSNISIFDSLTAPFIKSSIDTILSVCKTEDTLKLSYPASDAGMYFFSSISKNIQQKKHLKQSFYGEYSDITIYISKYNVNYNNMKNCFDCISRTIDIDLLINIKHHNGGTFLKYQKSFRDTIDRIRIPNLEGQNYQFCKAQVPEPVDSFWNEYFEPIVFTIISVVCVSAFFLVRSK